MERVGSHTGSHSESADESPASEMSSAWLAAHRPPPPPVVPSVIDIDARRHLWTTTAAAAVLGGSAGAAFSVYSGYPLHRAVTQTAFNWGLVTFTFLGSSLLCAELAGLPSSSLSNQLAAGSLTFTALLSLQQAAHGRITSSTEARRVGVRAAAVGAVCGGGVWAIKQLSHWWHSRRAAHHLYRESQEAQEAQSAASGRKGGWLPAWSPVRVATDVDLARADRVKAERERRGYELQQQRLEQRRQQTTERQAGAVE